MTHTCLYSQSLGKVVLLFVMALLLAGSSFAQSDLQVLVSGPWSYVTDQTNYPGRLLLVAPNSPHHKVYLLAGTGVGTPLSAVTPKNTGIYTLDYDPTLTGAYTAPPHTPPLLCGATVATVATVDRSTSNYVISLPMPAGFSTYSGNWSGTSESEVSSTHITGSNQALELDYTTVMVLHYGVKSIPASLQLNTVPPGSATPIPTTDSSGNYPGGVSIIVADPNIGDNDTTCDHVSLESVHERDGLWTITQYARFPEETIQGQQWQQIPGQYDYTDCSDSDPTVHPLKLKAKIKAKGLACRIPNLLSAGSADCHACQLSINGAVQAAIIGNK